MSMSLINIFRNFINLMTTLNIYIKQYKNDRSKLCRIIIKEKYYYLIKHNFQCKIMNNICKKK